MLIRELDERPGFTELIEQHLRDSRAKNVRYGWLLLAEGVAAATVGGFSAAC